MTFPVSFQSRTIAVTLRRRVFRTRTEAITYEQARRKSTAAPISVDVSYGELHEALGPTWNKRACCAIALLPILNGVGDSTVLEVSWV
jgi:hypothetical protein